MNTNLPKRGRPTKPNARNVPKAIKVSQEVADYLTQHGSGKCEGAIRRSKEFRDWVKSR